MAVGLVAGLIIGRWWAVVLLPIAVTFSRYQSAAPDTEVVTASGVDAHNDLVRYAWKIVDRQGHDVMVKLSWKGCQEMPTP